MAPADEAELNAALRFALGLDRPSAIRYPRDRVPPPLADDCPPFELGQSRTVRHGSDATVIAYGSTVTAALQAADNLVAEGLQVRVINARFAKPIDSAMLTDVLTDEKVVVTVEDHSLAGGFGSAVLEAAQELGLSTDSVVRLGLPVDRFIAHATRAAQLAEAGIDAAGIAHTLRRHLGRLRGEAAADEAKTSERPSFRRGDTLALPDDRQAG
jgi:1-deoxy-D-xylulose-5-phosphate synthase